MQIAARIGSLALGISLTVLPLAASGGDFNSPQADNNRTVLALEEESIPGADLPSPTAGASPSSGADAPSGAASVSNPNPAGWQKVPESPGASSSNGPASASTPEDDGDEDEAGGMESPPASASSVSPAPPSPSAQPTDVPPAMDIGSLTPTLAVSDSSLAPLINSAPTPARAASLRITEQGRRLLAGGHRDEALRDLAHAVSIDPSNSYAYFYLGRAYVDKKDCAQAITFFKRAEIGVGTSPAWLGETYAFEGQCYEQNGKSAQAFAAYQKALAATPGNLSARVGATRLSDFAPVSAPPGPPPAPDLAPLAPAAVEVLPPPAEPPPPSAPAPSRAPED